MPESLILCLNLYLMPESPSMTESPSYAWISNLMPESLSYAWISILCLNFYLMPEYLYYAWIYNLMPESLYYAWISTVSYAWISHTAWIYDYGLNIWLSEYSPVACISTRSCSVAWISNMYINLSTCCLSSPLLPEFPLIVFVRMSTFCLNIWCLWWHDAVRQLVFNKQTDRSHSSSSSWQADGKNSPRQYTIDNS